MSFHHDMDGIRIDPLHLLDWTGFRYRCILDASIHSVIQVVVEAKSEVSTSSTDIPFGFALSSSSWH